MGISIKPVIAVAGADNYDRHVVSVAAERLFNILGLRKKLAGSGQVVALKPNLLMAAEPGRAVTTHPEVVRAVADICCGSGAKVRIVDSPGSGTPWNKGALRRLYAGCGMEELSSKSVELNYNTGIRKVSSPEGKLVRHFELIEAALDADMLISISKAKTHSFAFMTCAVKNLFGLVPGFDKPGYHSRMKTPENFAEMLVDLAEYVKPDVSVVDAIVGMEGDGPTGGSPRNLGILLASEDPYALDVAVAHIMGFDAMQVPLIAAACRRGLTTGKIEDIEILGDVDLVRPAENFVLPRTVGGTGFRSAGRIVEFLQPILKKVFTLTPAAVKSLCVGCGACVDACPNVAISIETGKAKIARDQCIRCYCCHEACSHNAMKLKGSILYRLFHKVFR